MRVEDMCNKYLCQEVRNALINADITRAEEIRLRVGKNIKIKYSNGEKNIGYTVTSDNIENIFGRLTQYSPYAYKEEINCGYITIEGGYRVGIAGTVVDEGGQVQTIKNISSLNIRIAREIKGCSKDIISYINGNTIIVSLFFIPFFISSIIDSVFFFISAIDSSKTCKPILVNP